MQKIILSGEAAPSAGPTAGDAERSQEGVSAVSGALAGVKVADFSWAAAAPIITRSLADHGATVVRVESRRHPDSVRFGGPFRNDEPGINKSGFFADFNSSKMSLSLDMSHEGARPVALRLIDWADVVVESFTPRVMEGWGLGYDALSARDPSIVMLSSSLQGATGPYRDYAGYGGQGAALAGIHYLTGWPDRSPAGPKGAYTDTIAPRFGIAVLLAALRLRDRSGVGQYIDLCQVETGLQFLGPEILDYSLSGRVASARGNRSDGTAPCGAYPCQGDDRWITIEVPDDDVWMCLVAAMGSPEWATDPRWGTVLGRLERQDELDEHLGAWTSGQNRYELLALLQRHGVPSGVVQTGSDLFRDPQLAARGHFVPLDHIEMGRCLYNGPAFHLSETPAHLRSPAPLLGEHTTQVMTELLGYSTAEVDELVANAVLH